MSEKLLAKADQLEPRNEVAEKQENQATKQD
jgi:hypothetical protein